MSGLMNTDFSYNFKADVYVHMLNLLEFGKFTSLLREINPKNVWQNRVID